MNRFSKFDNAEVPATTSLDVLTGETGVTASQLFERKRPNRLARISIFTLALVLIGAVCWASMMPLAEISVSSGEIVPTGSMQQVQHLEGGIVAEVLVDEGELVEKGQTLVIMAPDGVEPEIEQLQTRLATADLRVELLKAALKGEITEEAGDDTRLLEIANAERNALIAKRQSVDNQSAVLTLQANERKAALNTLQAQISTITSENEIVAARLSDRQSLVEKGLFARLDLVDDVRDLARLTGEGERLGMESLRIAEQIEEIQGRVAELKSRFRSDLSTELSTLTNEAAELRFALKRARDRFDRLTVVSPTTGRVQGLQTRTVGGVIAPGSTLMDIVPYNETLFVEARINTSDIGYISVGQEANIKVLTYDYTRYGTIKGRVAQLSPSTFVGEDGTPFYKVRIDLSAEYVGDDESLAVSPGMTVLADIITGNKTLLTYIISPILRSFEAALHER